MDNVIPPLSSPNLNNPAPDKVVSGEVENVSGALQNIRPTESLLLKILMSDESSLSGTVKINLNGKEVEVPVKIAVEGRLELPTREDNRAVVRLFGPDNSQARILSINNDNPGKFISAEFSSEQSATAVPLIVDTGNALKNVSLHPLDLSSLIERVAKEVDLPQAAVSGLKEGLADGKVILSLSAVVENMGSGKELKKMDNAVNNSLERLKLILNNFSRDGDFDTASLKEALNQIKSEILPFKNMPLPGAAVTADAGNLIAVRTRLGNVLLDMAPVLDSAVKITDGTPLILEIKDFVFTDKPGTVSLNDLLSSQKLTDELAGLKPLPENSRPNAPKRPVIFKILEPLKNSPHADLSARILEKMPGQNQKMLANLVSFMKGAVNNDLSRWLGKEVVQDLKMAGSEGQEAAARLNNFMTASVREGVSWRLVEIPFLSGEQLSKIRVAVKKTDEEEGGDNRNRKKASGLRFVVDTSFSKLGDFQFDGFAIEKEKRFDLIIRTSRAVEDDLYANLLRIFKNTLHELDYTGNVKLNVKENFIKVCEDAFTDKTLQTGIYI